MRHLVNLTLFMMLSISSYAQFSISGQVRPRAELYNGTNSALAPENSQPGLTIQQRTRLAFQFEKDNVIVHFTPQYINFWGQYAENSSEGMISVFEAWAGYKFSKSFTLQFGRQPISYGDQRFLGALDWAASGRAHDALVGKWRTSHIKIDAGATWNQVGFTNDISAAVNTGEANAKSLQYLWIDGGGKFLKYSIVGANIVTETTPGTYYSYGTFGLIPKIILSDNFSINASGYVQLGKFKGKKVAGSLFSLEGTYKLGKMPLTAGADVVSGDKENTGKDENWKQPFGTNHKFYGFMDFFYVGEQPTMGLNDYYFKTAFPTGEKSKLISHLHYFAANQKFTDKVSDTGLTSEGYLGTEVDLIYDRNIGAELNLKVGYSQLFASDNFEMYKSGSADRINNWAWVQLSLNTEFFHKNNLLNQD